MAFTVSKTRGEFTQNVAFAKFTGVHQSENPRFSKCFAVGEFEYSFHYRVCACDRRRKIPKSKTTEPVKVLSSSGIRGTKFIPVYNFPAQ